MKFFEKGELVNFCFQKDFLRFFEYIMKKNRFFIIWDMVICCIVQMVNFQVVNICLGWKNIFVVFYQVVFDYDGNIVELVFQIICYIVIIIFQYYFFVVIDFFQDVVKCLLEFVCNVVFFDISMEVIWFICFCGKYVFERFWVL